MVPHIEYLRCNFRHSPTRFCRLHYSANSGPTYTAAEVSFPRNRLRAPTQPLRRNSSLPCSLTELVDLPPRRRANAGVSGEQMLDVTGSEDDGTVARLRIASCADLAASRNNQRNGSSSTPRPKHVLAPSTSSTFGICEPEHVQPKK